MERGFLILGVLTEFSMDCNFILAKLIFLKTQKKLKHTQKLQHTGKPKVDSLNVFHSLNGTGSQAYQSPFIPYVLAQFVVHHATDSNRTVRVE